MLIILMALVVGNVNAGEVPKQLDRAAEKAAKRFHVDKEDLLKIAFLEGSWRLSPPDRDNGDSVDRGPFQINSVHWHTTCKYFNIDKILGNAYCAAKLLAMHKKFETQDPNWKGRYHSKTHTKKIFYANKLEQVVLAENDD